MPLLSSVTPTAQASSSETTETLFKKLLIVPAGFGLGTIFHLEPFQRSMSVCVLPPWGVKAPTAQGGSTQTLIERWNGSKWKIVPSPNPAGAISSFLNSVSVVSEDDAWAVGVTEDSSGILHTLIEHLDHNTWVIVNSPSPGPQSNFLQG